MREPVAAYPSVSFEGTAALEDFEERRRYITQRRRREETGDGGRSSQTK